MPPFRLVFYRDNPQDNKLPKTLNCKKVYGKHVKVTDWEKYQDSQPIDTDPYCPEGYSLHNSHYRFFGTDKHTDYKTTTQDMLESGAVKIEALGYKKNIVNFYTVHDIECPEIKTMCPPVPSNDYVTTMQHSYRVPFPYEMKRLSMPTIPFYENRKLESHPRCKFLDDNFMKRTKLLQKHKGLREVSYNPCTNLYTDGTEVQDMVPGCVDLNDINNQN